jgi:hypothetical protein
MPEALPLDDLIGRTYYIDGALWRYLYNEGIRRFALRRTMPEIPFAHALQLIATGKVLWTPPERFEPIKPGMPMETIQQRVALLDAFRRSPSCVESTDWSMRARVDELLSESRSWLTRRALMPGDATGDAEGGGKP